MTYYQSQKIYTYIHKVCNFLRSYYFQRLQLLYIDIVVLSLLQTFSVHDFHCIRISINSIANIILVSVVLHRLLCVTYLVNRYFHFKRDGIPFPSYCRMQDFDSEKRNNIIIYAIWRGKTEQTERPNVWTFNNCHQGTVCLSNILSIG